MPSDRRGRSPADGTPLVSVRGLRKHYPITGGLLNSRRGVVKAVDGVDFDVFTGETLGIAGESGCGKTTVAKTVLHLVEPTDGSVTFDGRDVTALATDELRELRSEIGVVYQDPFSSLNPRMTVRKIVSEPLRTHRELDEGAMTERVARLLERVGLQRDQVRRYPHEFSGGQRQRIAIARALALEPSFVILDEPTSALDVSVQAKILNLLDGLQAEFDLTYLFITHDLNVMRHIADRILIMYLGHVMERGPTAAVFEDPHHPYTETLLAASPEVGKAEEGMVLEGEVPSPREVPAGCVFHTRCPYAEDACGREVPALHTFEGGDDDRARRESRCLFDDPRGEPPVRF